MLGNARTSAPSDSQSRVMLPAAPSAGDLLWAKQQRHACSATHAPQLLQVHSPRSQGDAACGTELLADASPSCPPHLKTSVARREMAWRRNGGILGASPQGACSALQSA